MSVWGSLQGFFVGVGVTYTVYFLLDACRRARMARLRRDFARKLRAIEKEAAESRETKTS